MPFRAVCRSLWLAAPPSPPNPSMIRRLDGYESFGLHLNDVGQLSKEVGRPLTTVNGPHYQLKLHLLGIPTGTDHQCYTQ